MAESFALMAPRRSGEDARYVRAFRAAAKANGMPKDAIDNCVSWYDQFAAGGGFGSRTAADVQREFVHYAEQRGFDPNVAMQSYSGVQRYGADAYLPSPSQDAQIIRNAERWLKEDVDSYWHPDREADREAYTDALERRAAAAAPPDVPPGRAAYKQASAQHNATRRAAIEGMMRAPPGTPEWKGYWASPSAQAEYREILSAQVQEPDPMQPGAAPIDTGAVKAPSGEATLGSIWGPER